MPSLAGFLTAVVASPWATGAIPSPQILYHRVLRSDGIAIVSLRKVAKPEGWRSLGDCYQVTWREILLDREPARSLNGFGFLDNAIPGSSLVGHKHPVVEGVDAVLFTRRPAKGLGALQLLSFSLNSVVPLQGRLKEYTARKFEAREMPFAEFLATVRRTLAEFKSFAFLREEFTQALGSRQPFNAWDKPELLRLLLALPDPQVPAYAASLRDADLPDTSRAVLERYLARAGDLAPLRRKLEGLLSAYRDGDLSGTEMFVFPDGSMNPRRERRERLLDAAMDLVESGDAAFAASLLMPVVRAGDLFTAPPLIRAGNEEALTRTLAPRRRGLPAVRALLRSGERTAVLAAIRVALEAKQPERDQLVAAVRRGLSRHGPPAEATAAAWQEFWRRKADSFPAAFPEGTLDQHLGTAGGFRGGVPR